MHNDPTRPISHPCAAATTPARLGRFLGHLEHGHDRRRRWHGRLPLGAIAPLLASAAAGASETLLTAEASEAVRVSEVWFDAEHGEVACELEVGDPRRSGGDQTAAR